MYHDVVTVQQANKYLRQNPILSQPDVTDVMSASQALRGKFSSPFFFLSALLSTTNLPHRVAAGNAA